MLSHLISIEIPRLQSRGLQRVGHDWVTLSLSLFQAKRSTCVISSNLHRNPHFTNEKINFLQSKKCMSQQFCSCEFYLSSGSDPGLSLGAYFSEYLSLCSHSFSLWRAAHMELATAINQLQPPVNLIPGAGEAVKPVCLNVSESFCFQFWSFMHLTNHQITTKGIV